VLRFDRLPGELQHTLATLADVEMRHDREREQLDAWAGPSWTGSASPASVNFGIGLRASQSSLARQTTSLLAGS
jgi:hypothetical protein